MKSKTVKAPSTKQVLKYVNMQVYIANCVVSLLLFNKL